MSSAEQTVTVVTGAASGIGRAIARRLVVAGRPVAALDIDVPALRAARSELGELFLGLECDVSSAESIDAAFDRLEDSDVLVSGLVTSAGIGGEPGDVTATAPAFWERTMAVNLTGVYLASRRAIPLMVEAGRGSIVHIASQLGMVGTTSSPAYSASKGGVIALARSMALDHASQRIRVNVVCPGPIRTAMFEASSGPANLATLERDRIPWGRIGDPDEVAALTMFLLGGDADYLTGAVIPIDGGWTAK